MNRSRAACLARATAWVIERDGALRNQAIALLRGMGFGSIVERPGSRGLTTLPRPAPLTLVLCEAALLVGLDGLRLMRWMSPQQIFCALTDGGKVPVDTLSNVLVVGHRMGLRMFGELPSPPTPMAVHVLIEEYLAHQRHAHDARDGQLFAPQEIDGALSNRLFIAHYRPLVNLVDTGRLRVSVDMHWRRADRTFMSQTAFLKYFDAPAQYNKLFESAVNQVFSLQRALKDEHHEVTIALPLFSSTVIDADLPRKLAGLALRYGIIPTCITFEVPGDAFEACTASATAQLNLLKLRRLGFGICLVCKGADTALMKERMSRLPASEIRIDLHCATDLARTPAVYVHTLASCSLVNFARALGVTVIGVVDAIPRDTSPLCELGCDFIQGVGPARANSAIELIGLCCRLRDLGHQGRRQTLARPTP